MKTILLLFTGMLMTISTVTAKNNTLSSAKHYHIAQPISFVERGVEFFIFPDGSFDFNSNYNNSYYNRRNTINATYNDPRVTVNYSSSRTKKTNIYRDRNGTIRSIDNVSLNYDRYGKITRIGSVFIDYGRGKNTPLRQVGNLKVKYNKWGEIISMRGAVNHENRFVAYHLTHNNKNYAYNKSRYDNDDDNYFYYEQNGAVKKQKKR